MKKLILIFTGALAFVTNSFSQSTASEINKNFYLADANISILINYIPEGWTFIASGDTFIIRSCDTAWVLEENRINVPREDNEKRIQRILAKGKRIIPEILIKYEVKWSLDKIQQAKIFNTSIENKIQQLEKKYNIDQIEKKVSKNGIEYFPINEKENKLLDAYYKEKEELTTKKINIPDFHTQKYSLYIISKQGCNDENHIIHPDNLSTELYTILTYIREICGQ